MRAVLIAAALLAAAVSWADGPRTGTATTVQKSCTSSSSIIAPKGGRTAVTVLNQSSTDAFICWGSPCTTSTGVRFQENMGFVEENYFGDISCITSSGTATLGVVTR